jgi:hypothetical protein
VPGPDDLLDLGAQVCGGGGGGGHGEVLPAKAAGLNPARAMRTRGS